MRLLEQHPVSTPVPSMDSLPFLLPYGGDTGSTVAQLRNALWRLEAVRFQRRSLVELESVLLREIKTLEEQCRADMGAFITRSLSDLASACSTFSEEDSTEEECNNEDVASWQTTTHAIKDASSRQPTTANIEDYAIGSLTARDHDQRHYVWPLAMTPRGGCVEVVRKYVRLPVTLYCGRDVASNEVERSLRASLASSLLVDFGVRHFDDKDSCTAESLLSEQVALICLRCDDTDKDAGGAFGRQLAEMLHLSVRDGKTASSQRTPAAVACFFLGTPDARSTSCRNAWNGIASIAHALEGLGSTSLIRCAYVHDTVEDNVMHTARGWAANVAQQAQQFARGQWVPEPEN